MQDALKRSLMDILTAITGPDMRRGIASSFTHVSDNVNAHENLDKYMNIAPKARFEATKMLQAIVTKASDEAKETIHSSQAYEDLNDAVPEMYQGVECAEYRDFIVDALSTLGITVTDNSISSIISGIEVLTDSIYTITERGYCGTAYFDALTGQKGRMFDLMAFNISNAISLSAVVDAHNVCSTGFYVAALTSLPEASEQGRVIPNFTEIVATETYPVVDLTNAGASTTTLAPNTIYRVTTKQSGITFSMPLGNLVPYNINYFVAGQNEPAESVQVSGSTRPDYGAIKCTITSTCSRFLSAAKWYATHS